jgi:membrane-associated phospholipid phosphatase
VVSNVFSRSSGCVARRAAWLPSVLPSVLLALGLALMATARPAAAADEAGWRTASDVGVVALMATALAVPLVDGDDAGARQAALSLVAISAVTEGLKAVVSKERPDGSGDDSFPSGHTARSFAAAATLWTRRGAGVGAPALAVAGLVGVARVEGRKHAWADVLAGAALGGAAGWLCTDARGADGQARVVPWLTTDGGGVLVAARF